MHSHQCTTITTQPHITKQNCHLAQSWMPRLEQIVTSELPAAAAAHDTDARLHPSFRLWLTSAPSAHFPAAVLQAATKVALEPPRGVRAQALRGLAALPAGYLAHCDATGRGFEWRRLLLSGVLLHAVVQERRRYGALGWNHPYEFSEGDLTCSLAMLQMFLTEGSTGATAAAPSTRSTRPARRAVGGTSAAAMRGGSSGGRVPSFLRRDSSSVPSSPSSPLAAEGLLLSPASAAAASYNWVPWEGLQFVTGQIVYGGRMTDENDQRLLGALVGRHYCTDALAPGAALAGGVGWGG